MKRELFLIILTVLMVWSCARQTNPFFSEFDTPFGVPPFEQIEENHYFPAFRNAVREQREEIARIIENAEAPTFANTIEALDYSGSMLRRVDETFNVLNGSMTNETMQKIDEKIAPLLSKHRDDILLNEDLFERVKAVYDARETLDLNEEQQMLLEKTYKGFVRGGVNLDEEKKRRLRELNEELSLLSIKFGQNILKENNRWEMVIEDEADLAGLPESVINGAAEAAEERGHAGKWVFTLHKPSMIPFLQYSEKRDFREKIFTGYINRGNHDDELDNKKNLSRVAALRVERAQLLGYETHAHYILERNMAKLPEHVYDLLDQLWRPALEVAKQEAADLQSMMNREGIDGKLQPWDWWYYAEKLKKEKYDLDDEILRPYFKLENVIEGVFYVANQLFGLRFVERDDIPKYHEDVTVFEVEEADGSHVGILYTDYFPRASKRGGAWMNSFRKQYRRDGEMIHPIITNNGNFSKPTGDKPALISLDEVGTLFHEFGHALHGLLSNCTYYRLSGTSVSRDFVELPSQIMENWAMEPEVLKIYARHFETNEPIPDDLIKKIKRAGNFNQGFATVEYLAASYLDMDWHTETEPVEHDAVAFEDASMERIGLIPEIVVRYRSPYFQHIFSGGYSSGYYSYIWAEVLDADAFNAFKETGLFDRKTAEAFRKHILEKGGTEEPMTLYMRFRGSEPGVKPLLKRRGLL